MRSLGIVLALLIFSAIVLFHEFGHFLVAKLNKVTVVEFSLGMGPRLLSFVGKSGTRYSWKVLPFGGSCQMLGEDMDETGEGTFGSKSVWARIAVIAAGPVFNFILAYILAVVLVSCIGYDLPVVLRVSEGYPAAQAGIEAGDIITSLNGTKIRMYRDVQSYVAYHQEEMRSGRGLKVTWLHEGEPREAMLYPQKDDESDRFIMGIVGSSSYTVKGSVPDILRYSFYEVQYSIRAVFQGLTMLVRGEVGLNDMSGPVGVVEVIDETYQESRSDGAFYVFLNMISLALLLSANLGVMNLLPIPALDGGRLVFLFVEVIRRRKLDPEIEARVNYAGFMLLMLLMVVILVNDVRKLIF